MEGKKRLVRLAQGALLVGILLAPRSVPAQLPDSCPDSLELRTLSRTGVTLRKTRIDTGWTGRAHERDLPEGFGLTVRLSGCDPAGPPCGECDIDGILAPFGRCSNDRTQGCNTINFADADDCGGSRCDFFGFPPTPENFHAVPVCIESRLFTDISGTFDVESGSMEINLPVLTDVYLGIEQSQPCPVCTGDVTPADGVRDGLCSGGERDGLACDVTATDPTFGDTSVDCPPNALALITGGGVPRELDLTTGTRSLGFGLPCDFPAISCPCALCADDLTVPCSSVSDCIAAGRAGPCNATGGAAFRLPNDCSDLLCHDSGDGFTGSCMDPVDRFCDGFLRASGEPIVSCVVNSDCAALDSSCPGSDCGDCTIERPVACFLDPIVSSGVANTTQPVLTDVICLSSTTNSAVNAVPGLPGPERVRLEVALSGICAAVDNCPLVDNPDQLNSDCPDPSFLACVGCSGTVPPALAGCCDGGDACDPCPAYADNTRCAFVHSGSGVITSAGGTVQTTETSGTISATVVLPAGAVADDTSISITENGPGTRFGLKREGGTVDVLSVGMRPEGQAFAVPVHVTLRWDDRDSDGIVDRGLCESGSDLNLPCDADADCAGNATCSIRSSIPEHDLVLKRNNNRFGRNGIGNSPYRCDQHLRFACSLDSTVACDTDADCSSASAGSCTSTLAPCSSSHADCSLAAGSPRRTVARCCDPTAGATGTRAFGEWEFETCDFSEFLVGLGASALVPGGGSVKTDCVLELAPNNPANEVYLDKKGRPNVKQACRDGDPVCDRDREANGACTFEIGLCVNVDDPRLVRNGEVPCRPTDVAAWRVLAPKIADPDPVKQADAVELVAKALGLGAGIEGAGTVTYSPAIASEACSSHARIVVPLVGGSPYKRGKLTIKVRAETSPPSGRSRGAKDTDKLKLTCLPSD